MAAAATELFILGFEDRRVPDELLERIGAGQLAGVVLFARNLGTLDEIVALTAQLHAAVPAGEPPPIVALDQEGGRVQRVRAPLTAWPPMALLGERDDEPLSEAVGRALGSEVAALGFNVDFAPVLDVHTNPENPIIGDRAFGRDPDKAARHALAFWRGLEAAGVRGCGKHYPGHGDTGVDSHLDLPRVDEGEQRLRQVELAPFAAAARAGMPMIMTAHVLYPAIDRLPATLSRRWLTEILRGELGYDGVIVSDDFDMKAMADHFPVEESMVLSLMAGVDAFLACRDVAVQQKATEAIAHAAVVDPVVQSHIDAAAARLRKLRLTLRGAAEPGAVAALPLDEHARLAARMRGQADS
jgi:beta-N-acetylhexosaminidase